MRQYLCRPRLLKVARFIQDEVGHVYIRTYFVPWQYMHAERTSVFRVARKSLLLGSKREDVPRYFGLLYPVKALFSRLKLNQTFRKRITYNATFHRFKCVIYNYIICSLFSLYLCKKYFNFSEEKNFSRCSVDSRCRKSNRKNRLLIFETNYTRYQKRITLIIVSTCLKFNFQNSFKIICI